MRKTKYFFYLLAMLLAFQVNAQDGQRDVRFVITEPAICQGALSLTVDVEVKAAVDPGFFMSEQNYRFSFNGDALENPAIAEETLTGFVSGGPGPLGFSLYSPHNLIGSIDTVVSYNLELQGGDGLFVTSDDWIKIGRLSFDVLDENACFDFLWHNNTIFPSTFVGEVFDENGIVLRRNTGEGTYDNLSNCLQDVCVLPVELVAFEGEERDCKVHLNWQTASETNSQYFIIERSANGVQFEEVGRIDAAGESEILVDYHFSDIGTSLLTYYRLKQVDIDGTYAYSDIIKIDTDCTDSAGDILDIFPNPVSNSMQIRLYSNTHEHANIVVMGMQGRVLFKQAFALTEGPNFIDCNVADLAAGTYFVRIEGASSYSKAHKFIKMSR